MSSSLLRDIEPRFPPDYDHLKSAIMHLRSMPYGDYMKIVEAATTGSNHQNGRAVRKLVADRLWKWLNQNA